MQNSGQTGSFSWRHADKAWLSEQIQLWRSSFNLKHGFRQKQFTTWFFFERKYSEAQDSFMIAKEPWKNENSKDSKLEESFVSLSFIFGWSEGVHFCETFKMVPYFKNVEFFIDNFDRIAFFRKVLSVATFYLQHWFGNFCITRKITNYWEFYLVWMLWIV